MIDWITALLPYSEAYKLPCGRVCSITHDGEPEWEVRKRLPVEGSHSQKICVRIHDDHTIELSGNPVKFLQGHNIFGSDDLLGLVRDTMIRVLSSVDFDISKADLDTWSRGNYPLTRVDVNYSYPFASSDAVLSFLHHAEQIGTLTHRGQGTLWKGTTLYFGKKSRHWMLKMYSKGKEIIAAGHKLPQALAILPALVGFAEKALRIEVTLRSRELKKLNLHLASSWNDTTPSVVYNDKVQGLTFAGNTMTIEDMPADLPTRLRSTFTHWNNGEDLRALLPRNTFYRHRKALLVHGIDIRTIRDTGKKTSNVVPLFKIVELVPMQVPAWAIGTDLYYEPKHSVR